MSIGVLYSHKECIVFDTADEENVRAAFFKTRKESDFKYVTATDFAYMRATAAPVFGSFNYEAPSLLVSTNLSHLTPL